MKFEDLRNCIFEWPENDFTTIQEFNKLFNIEGIPLSWFYKKLLLPYVAPKKLNTTKFIENNQKLPFLKIISLFFYSKTIPFILKLSEKMKIRSSLKNIKENDKPKALFLTYNNHISKEGKIFRIQDIITEVSKFNSIQPFVISASPLSNFEKTKSNNFKNIYDYLDLNKETEIRSKVLKIKKEWNSFPLKSKASMFKCHSKSLWDYLKYTLNFYFSDSFLEILVRQYELFKTIIDKKKISIIVLTSQNLLFERCAIAAANHYKIPVLVIQHGIGLGSTPISKTCPINFAVFGKEYEKKLISWGLEKSNIHIVGPVIFDKIISFKGSKVGEGILIATIPIIRANLLSEDEYFTRLQKIIIDIRKNTTEIITIKLHPREDNIKVYKAKIKSFGIKNVKILAHDISREKFYSIMADCRLFIHFGSTAAIEALILDRPIITINILDDNSRTKWIEKENISVNITYKESFSKAIKKLNKNKEILNSKSKSYLTQKYTILDGKSYQRIAKLIENLSKTN